MSDFGRGIGFQPVISKATGWKPIPRDHFQNDRLEAYPTSGPPSARLNVTSCQKLLYRLWSLLRFPFPRRLVLPPHHHHHRLCLRKQTRLERVAA